MKVLIVGIDSLIGNSVAGALVDSGINVIGTTRRKNSNAGSIFFDLSAPEDKWTEWSDDIDVAFIASAITKQSICNDDPEFAEFINVTQTLKLIKQLHDSGVHVIFPSTNIVLACDKIAQKTDAALAPIGKYAQGKAKVERALSGLSNAAIARLPKILDSSSGVINDWTNKLSKGETIKAYTNLIISPVSLTYVTLFIVALIKDKKSGIWHLSGDSEISYYNLACKLAKLSDPPLSEKYIIKAQKIVCNNFVVPEHPSLDCCLTESKFGIAPQSVDNLLKDLL